MSSHRWQRNTHDKTKSLAHQNPSIMQHLLDIHQSSPFGTFEVREHIDYCFTCLSKTLPIDQQIALILKDIYGFKVKELAQIMELSLGVVKHLLIDARKTMREIFDFRCALVNKEGVCNQCSELKGLFNPKQQEQIELLQLEHEEPNEAIRKKKLYDLRIDLVKWIDPLNSAGADLHLTLFQLCEEVNSTKD